MVENLSWLDMPAGSRLELFGAGGCHRTLTESTGTKVGLLGQVPIDVAVREGGDSATRSS